MSAKDTKEGPKVYIVPKDLLDHLDSRFPEVTDLPTRDTELEHYGSIGARRVVNYIRHLHAIYRESIQE